ncbi:MAG: uncharacterized membrane protein YsdA (DUF1294 family)/cold shock CspA family protein [Colwellia sp.]|jgi:uncharacterized membrane protein YsdA (DUF1294 family)/cold shock CspA family protein
MVVPLSSSATQDWFSSLAPYGQADKGSSPALWISTIEQLFSSIHALYLTLSRLAETCILRGSGYNGGSEHVFIHKTAFSNRKRTPQINNVITFSITKDNQGRFCADDATFSGEKLIKKQGKRINKFSIYLSVIFLGLMIAVSLMNYIPINLVFIYLGASIVTFIAYAFDKSKAQRGAWRTPESTLHFFALMGGWPGAAIAQQTLRHKSQKKDFRLVFWLTVIVNCGVLAWLTSANSGHWMSMFK